MFSHCSLVMLCIADHILSHFKSEELSLKKPVGLLF